MRIYLAGTVGRRFVVKEELSRNASKIPILESFYYIQKWMLPHINKDFHFILDSGAFTFFGKQGESLDWDQYLNNYADFINANDVQDFFELDIDMIVGIEEVERYRERLIALTGKTPIVVWRPSRGIDYWQQMITKYPHIAISASGAYDSAWTRKKGSEHVLRQMVQMAHDENVRVHGLGYTALKHLKYIGWDSVDSTTWAYGNMTGMVFQFSGTTMISHKIPRDRRLLARETAIHNFCEWAKFQKYAKDNL